LQKIAGAVMLVSNQNQEVFIMLTYKKVLEVFKDYLAEDESCEVLTTSQGYLVVDWNSRKSDSEWVTSRLCQTPEHLRDVLRSRYEEYQGYKLTGGYKRELLPSEDVDIRRMGEAMSERCGEN
jgi:hypothetical protein